MLSPKSALLLPVLLVSLLSASEPETIQYWHVGTSDDVLMMRRFAARFYEETGIRVIVTPLGWNNFEQKYLAALAAQLPPDIGSTNLGGPYEYGRVAGVVDLAREFPEDLAALQAELLPGLWPQFTVAGKVFGLPHQITTLCLYYRKDIFARLGLEPPSTWSEMVTVVEALERADYQYGFYWTREDGWAIDTWCHPHGVLRYSPDQHHATWDDPRFQRGVQTAVRLWNLHNMPFDKAAKPVELFALTEADHGLLQPLFIDGLWRYMEVAAKAPHLAGKWAIAPLPTGENGRQRLVMGGTALVIFRLSQHQRAAMQWARFLLSPEMQYEYFRDNMFNRGERGILYCSANRRMYELYELPLDSSTTHTIRTSLSHIGTLPSTPGAAQADRLLDHTLKEIRAEVQARIAGCAAAHNLPQWELKRAFAAGKYAREKAQLHAFADSVTAARLNRIKPAADAELARARAEFERYSRHVLDDAGRQAQARDVLDYAKAGALLLCAGGLLTLACNRSARRHWRSYFYIAPALLLLIVFLLIPIAVSIYLSFTSYNPLMPLSSADWAGLRNYVHLFASGELWESLGRSLYFAVLLVPLQLAFGVILAVGLDQSLKPDRMFKFLYFSPLVTSIVSVALIWTTLYLGARYGWINGFLLKLGVVRDPILFLQDQDTFLNCVLGLSLWHGLAFVILINLAGLQNLPRQLHEAATIDGASAVQRFLHVTLPALRPQIVFLVIMGTIGAIQVFEPIYVLGGAAQEAGPKFGPADSGMTMVPLIFRKGFEDFRMGEASAVAYVLFAVIFVLSYLNWRLFAADS